MALSKRLFFLLLLLPLSGFAAGKGELYAVKEVLNAKSFTLESGDTVRLASLQAPNMPLKNGSKLGDPMCESAWRELIKLIDGKKVFLKTSENPRDRKNRIVAQVYLEDGTWVQEAMLESGMAMVYPIFEDTKKADLEKMLVAEGHARAANKGIWAHSYYKVLNVDNAGEYIDKFRVVRGVPVSIEAKRGNVYINFGKDWNSDLTAYIPKRYARSFEHSGIETMAGKQVEIRGWIEDKGGPFIELIRPEQIGLVK